MISDCSNVNTRVSCAPGILCEACPKLDLPRIKARQFWPALKSDTSNSLKKYNQTLLLVLFNDCTYTQNTHQLNTYVYFTCNPLAPESIPWRIGYPRRQYLPRQPIPCGIDPRLPICSRSGAVRPAASWAWRLLTIHYNRWLAAYKPI